MEIIVKKVPSMVFLASSHIATMKRISAISDKIVPQLFAAADQAGLSVAGPVQLLYNGVDAAGDKEFELVIGLPLSARPELAPPPFSLIETAPFNCAAFDYIGAMPEIRSGYDALIAGMVEQDLPISTKRREVYKHWIGFDSPENVTELQLGIA